MEFEGTKKVKTQLNIAPLIDVVFLLLIFFMLSSHFVTQPGIKITLPEASTAKLQPEEDIIIFITEDNELYLNEENITLTNLLDELRVEMGKTKKKTVIIKADEKIDLGLAVRVMDMVRRSGASKFVIATTPEIQ